MKAKTHREKRRGRKPGDGVLKELKPQDSYLEKAFKFAHGRTVGDPEAELVRTWRGIREILASPVNRKDKKMVNSWVRFEYKRLARTAMESLLKDKADWFRKMADAIDVEAALCGKPTHPLHAAILALACVPHVDGIVCGVDGPGTETAASIYFTGRPVDTTPRHTIAELCDILKKQGKRPQNQEDADWQRTVRRACDEIGFPYLPGKPGRRRKAT